MSVMRAFIYWLGAVLLTAVPVFSEPTKGYHNLSVLVEQLPANNYRDIAVLVLAVLGVAIFDANETARLDSKESIINTIASAGIVVLVINFCVCAIAYGKAAGVTTPEAKVPDALFCLFLLAGSSNIPFCQNVRSVFRP